MVFWVLRVVIWVKDGLCDLKFDFDLVLFCLLLGVIFIMFLNIGLFVVFVFVVINVDMFFMFGFLLDC